MASADDLAHMVPGFDFMQGMLKTATASLPSMGQWMAPTLNPEELDKRIQDLKTVQFWLEQNARLLGATIQGLEVQKLTLNTLKGMNLPLADLGEALRIRMPAMAAPPPAPPTPQPVAPEPARQDDPANDPAKAPSATTPLVDPMQWWGALTQQFTEIAARAVKDSGADAAMNLAGAVVKAPLDMAQHVAAGALKKSASGSRKPAAKPAPKSSAKPATKPAAARKRTR
ncbi:MAG: hypothetical protein KA141_03445 [Rubrivivax sp.]|nr:hypothetical protein [Rubrivivax sp.]